MFSESPVKLYLQQIKINTLLSLKVCLQVTYTVQRVQSSVAQPAVVFAQQLLLIHLMGWESDSVIWAKLYNAVEGQESTRKFDFLNSLAIIHTKQMVNKSI